MATEDWERDFDQTWKFLEALYRSEDPPGVKGAWRSVLRGCDGLHLRTVAKRAATLWPKWKPKAGEFLREVERIAAAERSAKARRPEPEPYHEPVLSPENPFGILAEAWKTESRRNGYRGDEPCPREVGLRRMKELNALLEKATIG